MSFPPSKILNSNWDNFGYSVATNAYGNVTAIRYEKITFMIW